MKRDNNYGGVCDFAGNEPAGFLSIVVSKFAQLLVPTSRKTDQFSPIRDGIFVA
jgi:hypothetical protein